MRCRPAPFLLVAVGLGLQALPTAALLLPQVGSLAHTGSARCRGGAPALLATKKKKKKASAARPNKISTRGFGGRGAAAQAGAVLLEEPRYEALYAWLRSSPSTNLHKVGVADFGGLRGVMALQDIAAGEEIVGIPASFAVDLGAENSDPLPAAQRLLAVMHSEMAPACDDDDGDDDNAPQLPSSPRAVYWSTLPPPDSPDLCTPDFFSEKELQMLQWPPLVLQVRQRSARIRAALGAAAPSGAMGVESLSAAGGSMRELRWAVWAVLSRVLTVAGPANAATLGGGAASGRKLLIPFLDMFNHRGGTKHYLTGRTDGMLRVVAGAPVKAGDQIFIQYGVPESTSNEEFVGHYGFCDPSVAAAGADSALVRAHRDALPALSFSSVEEDEALLSSTPAPPYKEQLALSLRLALKRAAAREGLLPSA